MIGITDEEINKDNKMQFTASQIAGMLGGTVEEGHVHLPPGAARNRVGTAMDASNLLMRA